MKPGWCFLIFWIFWLLFLNFLTRVGLKLIGSKKNFSLFFGLSRPVSAWNEASKMFFNFLNFVAIIFEFSISGRVETDRNEKKNFLYFSSCPDPFFLKLSLDDVSSFFSIFFEFSNSGRVGTDWNEIFFFFFLYFSANLVRFRLEMKPGWSF